MTDDDRFYQPILSLSELNMAIACLQRCATWDGHQKKPGWERAMVGKSRLATRLVDLRDHRVPLTRDQAFEAAAQRVADRHGIERRRSPRR
jgi:hypothetical protein